MGVLVGSAKVVLPPRIGISWELDRRTWDVSLKLNGVLSDKAGLKSMESIWLFSMLAFGELINRTNASLLLTRSPARVESDTSNIAPLLPSTSMSAVM